MEKVAFLGDFVLTDTLKLPRDYFDEIKHLMSSDGINVCVNLESPVVEKDMKEQKTKICLKCEPKDIETLKLFTPYLVNLSNNHINDYGNASVELTKKILNDANINFFGVGYLEEKNNRVFKNDESKIIYLAYCSRSSDFTGNKLFAEEKYIGGWEIDIENIKQIKEIYPDYGVIVNVHWGIENVKFPENSRCLLARQMVDAGADLIIGHHPHIIQPYEKYKGKYIFYSIGNFYFPEINFELQGKSQVLKTLSHQKKGIVPIIEIVGNKFSLTEILLVKNTQKKQVVIRNHKLCRIKTDTLFYKLKSQTYHISKKYFDFFICKLQLLITNPAYFFKKLYKKIIK